MKHDVMKNPFKDLNIMQSLNFQNMKQQIKEFNVKDLKKLFQDTLGIEPEGNLALAQSVIIIDKHTDTNFILTVRGQQFTLTAKNVQIQIFIYIFILKILYRLRKEKFGFIILQIVQMKLSFLNQKLILL